MIRTAADLLVKYYPSCVFTESDEITLVFPSLNRFNTNNQNKKLTQNELKGRLLFGGATQKIVSLFAGYCSARFVYHLTQSNQLPDLLQQKCFSTHFDARIFNLKNEEEVLENIYWRVLDCRRNSKSLLARKYISQTKMEGLNGTEQVRILQEKFQVDWHSYPGLLITQK
jgi:tRNA(His) guanylyltransferase